MRYEIISSFPDDPGLGQKIPDPDGFSDSTCDSLVKKTFVFVSFSHALKIGLVKVATNSGVFSPGARCAVTFVECRVN